MRRVEVYDDIGRAFKMGAGTEMKWIKFHVFVGPGQVSLYPHVCTVCIWVM